MKKVKINITPSNTAEECLLAEENFRLDVQYAILDAMKRTNTDRQMLAKLLKVSEANIDQIFSDKCNITIRRLGRIFYALLTECKLNTKAL